MSSKPHESRVDKKAASEPPGVQSGSETHGQREQAVEDSSPASEESANKALEAEARIVSLEAELAAVREELSSVNDKYLRKLADDANFRKRMTREKEDGQRFAVSALLGDLIPVLDDFDRAISSAETLKDYSVFHDGITLIRRQFGQVLENKYGLKRMVSRGVTFDPNIHEAVAVELSGADAGDEATVAEEFLPAYCLHERVLRTAKVKVRMPAPRSAEGPAASSGAAASPDSPKAGDGPDGHAPSMTDER